MGLDRKLQYHSMTGCCICGTKTSSSRFTSSARFESLFAPCFGIAYNDQRSGDICNACVLIVKRFRNSPRDSCKNWAHVSSVTANVIWILIMLAPSHPLDNIRVMMIVWRFRGNILSKFRTALCWIVWHNVNSQQHTYMSSSYRSNRLGLSHWDPYAVCRRGCLELYYCNMVVVLVGFKPDLWQPTGFLQCFDTVGLVIWPVKIIPEMTYNVLQLKWDVKSLRYY